MEFSIKDISLILDGEVVGNELEKINTISKIEEAQKGSISFLANPKYENFVYTTKASAVIVSNDFTPKQKHSASLIKVKDPYSSFTILLEEYNRLLSFSKSGIENPSFIGDNVTIGVNHFRGAFSYIGKGCKIGNNVKIYPNSYIGDNTEIGDNCIIYAGVKIYENSKIGSHCTLHSGAVIGSDGFGFAPQQDGTYKTIPQIGNVILEDHVSIGANTVVDCATMGSTIIRSGVKLDNLVQVAHNVEIGKNTVIAAQAAIAGSTKIGDNCIIGGQVGIVGHIKIANRVTIGAKSGVNKADKEGQILLGSPAVDHRQCVKTYAITKNLPQLLQRIEDLEEKVVNLPTTKASNEY